MVALVSWSVDVTSLSISSKITTNVVLGWRCIKRCRSSMVLTVGSSSVANDWWILAKMAAGWLTAIQLMVTSATDA